MGGGGCVCVCVDGGSLEALYSVHRQPMARGSTRVESVGCLGCVLGRGQRGVFWKIGKIPK